jgi:release factor glutamine methyltransferase
VRVVPGLKADVSAEDAIRMVSQSFRLMQIESPDVDARLLIGHALKLGRAQLVAQSERLLESREVNVISALAARRLKHEPVARILGRKEFWSLDMQVTPDVLVPRPETETIVESALDALALGGLRMEKLRILDIGTGSGALLLALLSELPNAVGTGTDISSPAIDVARANAERHDLAARCVFVTCDGAGAISGPFDLVVSNPPYIAKNEIASLPPEVRDHDPMLALDGGNDGLDLYRAIATDVPRLLAPGGRLIVEIGAGREPAVCTLFGTAGLTIHSVRKDLAGIARAVSAGLP